LNAELTDIEILGINKERPARKESQGWSPIVIRSRQLIKVRIDTKDFQYKFGDEDSLLRWSLHTLHNRNILFADWSLLLLGCFIKCNHCLVQFLPKLSKFLVFLLLSVEAVLVSNYWWDLGALSEAQSFLNVLCSWISLDINWILEEWVSNVLALCFDSIGIQSSLRFNSFCFNCGDNVLLLYIFCLDQGSVFEVNVVS